MTMEKKNKDIHALCRAKRVSNQVRLLTTTTFSASSRKHSTSVTLLLQHKIAPLAWKCLGGVVRVDTPMAGKLWDWWESWEEVKEVFKSRASGRCVEKL
jgi:hypothetical protein